MKQLIKSLLPPALTKLIQKYRNSKYGWFGNYQNWQQAENDSTGYDSDGILEKVKHSLLKVKKGEAVYERDSVLFDEIQYSWPLLSGILMASVRTGSVNVLDFGGSLGSSYFQNKKFLDPIEAVSWCIVEQEKFVTTGKEFFEDERLKFYYSVDECIEQHKPNVLLLSSVLQYIDKPYELLDKILKNKFEYIVIDRTSFNIFNIDMIRIQKISPEIYSASYPCWFFNKKYFINYFMNENFSLLESFSGSDGKNSDYEFVGMIFKKND